MRASEGGIVGRGSRRISGVVAAGVCAFVTGCANRAETVVGTLESSRIVESARIDFKSTAPHAERFGLVASNKPAEPAGGDARGGLRWKTPSGWTELPASSMRVANFRPAGDAAAECYLTLLGGDGGGLTANVNRWRSQISLGPLSADEIEALPVTEFFGRRVPLIECIGTWKGMNDSQARTDFGLLGLVLVEPQGSIFLKMTGPASTIRAQRENFLALAASFDDGQHATAPPSNAGGGFEFELPDTWRPTDAKASRTLSFFAGEGETVECYVTVLGGTAGGELANVNRWRTQLGLGPVDQAAIDALDPFPILGRPAHLVELEGATASMLGITCMGEDRSIFVKLTGPVDRVRAQRSNMLRFASSLKEPR